MNWSYYFTSAADNSNSFATRFGWGAWVPLQARVLPPGHQRKTTLERSFFDSHNPNILMVSARPSKDNKGIILHLRELDGRHTTINADGLLQDCQIKSVSEVNVLGEQLSDIDSEITMTPFSVKFIKIELE